jgi:prepilin-type N-terminal cleavage/methylation domain
MVTHKKSFTLIEVLIFVTILSLFFVAATTVTIVSLRNLKVQEHKILATRYAQELVEWLRGEKEIDWNQFTTHTGTYCFNSSQITSWGSRGNCSGYGLNNLYKREVTLTVQGNPAYQVNVSITVLWQELGQTYQVPINTVFTVWE